MKQKKQKGFTLTEVIVVVVIVSFLMLGLSIFMVESGKSAFITEEKLDINADVRQFTLEMAEYARASNYFYIYKSFNLSDRNAPSDRLRDGGNGDFLLLVFQEPWPAIDSPEHFTRVVGYFREADPNNPDAEGPVWRFEKRYHDPSASSVPPGSAGPYVSALTSTPEDLISDLGFSGSYSSVVQLSKGLANGQLFYNYLDRSIMVKAQIIHGNAAKRITDTYNYTVSPRG